MARWNALSMINGDWRFIYDAGPLIGRIRNRKLHIYATDDDKGHSSAINRFPPRDRFVGLDQKCRGPSLGPRQCFGALQPHRLDADGSITERARQPHDARTIGQAEFPILPGDCYHFL